MSQNSEIIQNILAEAIDISINFDTDIFFSYSPHVEWIEVLVFLNGWESYANYSFRDDIEIHDTEGLKELLEYVKSLRDAK